MVAEHDDVVNACRMLFEGSRGGDGLLLPFEFVAEGPDRLVMRSQDLADRTVHLGSVAHQGKFSARAVHR
jgi:hypothetical protein